MRTSYDSVNVLSLPDGANLYLGYDDGQWPDADAIAQRFPGKTVVRVTVNPADNEGDMLDVERGDANPPDAPGWIQRRRAAGHGGPLVYTSEANRSAVISSFATSNVPMPGLFIAAYPGNGAVLQQPTDVGHQYASNNDYDTSVVIDYLPGIDPTPAPPTTPPTPQENETVTSLVDGTQKHVWAEDAANHRYLHWWQDSAAADTGWKVEVLPLPT